MPVRKKRCDTCPFRGATEREKARDAIIDPEQWSCHSEAPYGWTDIQCRGHHAARLKYPPSAAEGQDFEQWQSDFNKAFAAGVEFDELPSAPVRQVVVEMQSREGQS